MNKNFENMGEYNPLSLDNIIKFMERTKDDKWCVDVVRTEDGKGCIMSHVFDMGGNFFWDMFESMYATTYMSYPVNDGTNPDYKQATPKERVIAWLKDMRDGKTKTVQQLEQEYFEQRKEELESKKHVLSIEQNPEASVATEDASKENDDKQNILPHFPRQNESFGNYLKRSIDSNPPPDDSEKDGAWWELFKDIDESKDYETNIDNLKKKYSLNKLKETPPEAEPILKSISKDA